MTLQNDKIRTLTARWQGDIPAIMDLYNMAMSDRLSPCIKVGINLQNLIWIMEMNNDISPTVKSSAMPDNNYVVEPQIASLRGRSDGEWHETEHQQRIEVRTDGNTNSLTSVAKDNMVLIPQSTKEGVIAMETGGVCDLSYPSSKTRRGRVQEGGTIAPACTCAVENNLRRIESNMRIRKLTERECFRLMGVADSDIDTLQSAGISKTQQYKMAGNSIVVDVLAAIFDKMFLHTQSDDAQLKLF